VLDPVLLNAALGQINAYLMLLILIDFAPSLPKRWRGIAVGIAAGIKLTPLMYVLYLFFTGRRREAGQALLTFFATVGIGFAVLPDAAGKYWFDGVFHDPNRILMSDVPVNHSLFGFFARLADQRTAPGWAFPICAVVAVLGLAAAVWAHRRGDDLLGILVVAFTTILVSPVAWPPHMVWVAPALLWLWFARWRTNSLLPRVILLLAVLWFELPVYWQAQAIHGGKAYQLTATGDLLATLGSPLTPIVIAMATLPWWLPRCRGPVATPHHEPG
jgi:alpha-1,2-mannosyltransferase